MNKIIKIYVGRGLDNNKLIDSLFRDGYKSENCMKQQRRNVRKFKWAVKNNGDCFSELAANGEWERGLYIYDHRELKLYNPNNVLVLTLGSSIPTASLENFEHIDLFDYLDAAGLDMNLFHRISDIRS